MKKLLQILLFTFVLGLFLPEAYAADARGRGAPQSIERSKPRKAHHKHHRTVRRQKRHHRNVVENKRVA